MSQRQLRKLQRGCPPADVEEHDDDIDDRPSKPRQSLFATFAALQDDDEEEGEDDENTDPVAKPEAESIVAPPKKNKKKRKKKKAAKTDLQQESESHEDDGQKAASKPKGKGKKKQPKDDGLDEIDRALKELDLQTRVASAHHHRHHVEVSDSPDAAIDAAIDPAERRIFGLLKVKPYHLKVVNEMKSLFGKDTVAAAEAEEETTRTAPPRLGQPGNGTLEDYLKALPNQGLRELSINKNYLIQGKKTWPMSTTAGLAMKTIDGPGHTSEFAFTHSNRYIALETQFFIKSSTYDPDLMVEFLHTNPYHISSLVIVSKIAKHQGDHALAADLRERALFTFGRTMISPFKRSLEQGKARLDFRRVENRQFWLAGHQYLTSLMRRGTHTTALEWARLLLQLDTSDPYAIGQLVHVIAIKAKEYRWLLDLCESGLLKPHWGYPNQSAALAKIHLGDDRGAVKVIRAGMQELPWLYSALFKELNMDVPTAIWGSTTPPGPDELYTAIYIHQAKDLWNYPKVTDVLFEAAHGFEKPPNTPKAQEVTLGVARMVYLDANQDLMAFVPRKMLHSEPNYDFDPLPPPLEDNIFSSPSQRLYFEGNSRQNEALAEQARQAVRAVQVGQAGVGEPAAVVGGQPLGGTINTVLDFMRTQLAGFAGSGSIGRVVANDLDHSALGEELARIGVNFAGEENPLHWTSDESIHDLSHDDGDYLDEYYDDYDDYNDYDDYQDYRGIRASNKDSDDEDDENDFEGLPDLVDSATSPPPPPPESTEQIPAPNPISDGGRRSLQATVEDGPESDGDNEPPPPRSG